MLNAGMSTRAFVIFSTPCIGADLQEETVIYLHASALIYRRRKVLSLSLHRS
jgi:hypothetical protein